MYTLYDVISYMVEEYEEFFTNESLIEDLVKCIITKWYGTPDDNIKTILPIFGKT